MKVVNPGGGNLVFLSALPSSGKPETFEYQKQFYALIRESQRTKNWFRCFNLKTNQVEELPSNAQVMRLEMEVQVDP